MATAVALIDAVESMTIGCHLGLRWPNDVYAGNRKLAGVLVDVLPDGRHVLGVGINTNNCLSDAPPELRDSAATIHWLTGRPVEHAELLEVFLEQLAIAFRGLARAPEEYGARFDALCVQHGEVLTVRNGAETTSGRCAGIAADGALLLDTEHGRRRFYSGTLR
jgi:BirA family transcriptional regulator, biotin operon repressor / biotin---[acetyl-CoA-carboxylase] ligase